MNSPKSQHSDEEPDYCSSSFGRPHLKGYSRASGHTCMSDGDPACNSCELLHSQAYINELHPPERNSTNTAQEATVSIKPTQGRDLSNVHFDNYVPEHQEDTATPVQAAANLSVNLETISTSNTTTIEASDLNMPAVVSDRAGKEVQGGQPTVSSPIPIPGREHLQPSPRPDIVKSEPIPIPGQPHRRPTPTFDVSVSAGHTLDSTREDDDLEPRIFSFDEELRDGDRGQGRA